MKKRLFYLDFIRAIATIAILLTHYNALYIYMFKQDMLNRVVITGSVANIYIGDFGVSLFFIISGASLMYVYDEKLELGKFYKKRIKSIFPMFYLAYISAFLFNFYRFKNIVPPAPKRNFLLTIFGMDGLFSSVVPTWYILGEWFLGFIILVYLIFPLLRFCVKKQPVITAIVVAILYVLTVVLYKGKMAPSTIITMRIPEILFGMLFVKFGKKVKWPVALGALAVLIVNSILKPQIHSSIQTTYIGIASFLLLVFISYGLEKVVAVNAASMVISKYSYAIFLVHHFIIYYVAGQFDLGSISVVKSYLLFVVCMVIIAFFARILYDGNRYITGKLGMLFKINRNATLE